MMQKSTRIRVIFRELRQIVGNDVPASDLVRLANFILRSQTEATQERDEFGRPSDKTAFFRLPIDEAMRDGGWRILAYEQEQLDDIDLYSVKKALLVRAYVSKYLGAEWRQEIQTG